MHREIIAIKTRKREELVDITAKVRELIRSKDIEKGCLVIFVPHTTAGITVNEGADPTVKEDLLYVLRKLIPHRDSEYKHLEGNSDAHIKASLLGSSLTLLIENGDLILGRWQAIFFAEFDGPRQRRIHFSLY
ncbi:MAG: YjbQ family protein [Firmicutes bacterium]|nr:YjbQ family protein [Bacillota bacterium]